MTTAGSLSCPSCGAAAAPEAHACAFCRTRLATIACPACFGMVFVGSRHCAHCGARARAPIALDGTPWKCPRGHGDLRGVALGGAEIGECRECAGLWLEEATFQALVSDRARASVVPQGGAAAAQHASAVADTVRYVPCPDCGKIMNRVNFAKSSGVILDACKGHGVWCDADELRRVVEFVRAGGMDVARRRETEQLVLERRRLEFVRAMDATSPAYQRPAHAAPPGQAGEVALGAGLSLLFSLLAD
jgi:Zn-finger nucleic acid-binding protein